MENKFFSSTSTLRFRKTPSELSENDILKKSFTSFGKLVLGDEKTNPILSNIAYIII